MRKGKFKFCVVIPAYMEGKYLPHLLYDIKKQSIQPSKIIVADANSTDKTRDIAQSFGCVVVDGGTPPVGRNRGAQACENADLIFFLDADVRLLDKKTFEKIVRVYEEKKFDLAFPLVLFKEFPYEHKRLGKELVIKIANWALKYSFRKLVKNPKDTNRFAIGAFMVVSKKWFDKSGGFDEFFEFGDDYMFFKKTIESKAKFIPIQDVVVHFSARRVGLGYLFETLIGGQFRKASTFVKNNYSQNKLLYKLGMSLAAAAAFTYGIRKRNKR